MFDTIGKITPHVRSRAWANIGHDGQTLEELKQKLLEAGNAILEVDEENQRILIARNEEAGRDVWGCRLCLAEGTIIIVDTEQELVAHCDENHPDWRTM